MQTATHTLPGSQETQELTLLGNCHPCVKSVQSLHFYSSAGCCLAQTKVLGLYSEAEVP